MEKVAAHTPDRVQANIQAIADLFPEVLTEALDAEGNVTQAVDFDALRQELSNHVVEGPQERYQLDWPGKRKAMLAANAPTASTLRPMRDESVNFDTTKNLFIEGDNLEALKILQESYLGKVKLIYIDPPYNTGNDFIYEDHFAETLADYLSRTGQLDDAGTRLNANTESNGRFHSDWLSMMYPRLKLARNLLRDDGAIFVSIDDRERDNLKRLMDVVFGADSFVAAVVWRKKASPDARSTIGAVHDYVLCYVRDAQNPKTAIGKMALGEKRRASFSNPDSDPRGPWASVDMTGMTGRATKDQYFSVKLPSGREVQPPEGRSWGLVERTFLELLADNRIWFGKDGDSVPRIKRFLSEVDGQTVSTYWDLTDVGSNEEASDEVASLFNGVRIFDAPKPVRLMRRLLEIGTQADGEHIVMDFFAGSSSMGAAVLQQNAEDGGNRRFLLVQLDEPCSPRSTANAAGYDTIASLARERIRRAGDAIAKEGGLASMDLDVGFRCLRVDSGSFTDVLQTPEGTEQTSLDSLADNTKKDRTDEDLLFQVMIDWGLELSAPIDREALDGYTVLNVDDGGLIACFIQSVSVEAVRGIALRSPLRVSFRDSSFDSDADRINVEQIFRELSPDTQVKVI